MDMATRKIMGFDYKKRNRTKNQLYDKGVQFTSNEFAQAMALITCWRNQAHERTLKGYINKHMAECQ